MPDFAGSKIQNPRCRQRQRGFKTKKGTNTTANPSYVSKKIFLPHLLYIVYQIFRRPQIFVGFFRGRLPADGNRHFAAVSRHDIRQLVFGILQPGSSFSQPFASLYRQTKPPSRHCTSSRLDRPALSRQPLSSLQSKSQSSVCKQSFLPAPKAPATTFQEPQTNKQKNLQKQLQKYPSKSSEEPLPQKRITPLRH